MLILSSIKVIKKTKGVKVQPEDTPTVAILPLSIEEEYKELLAEIEAPRRPIRPRTGFQRSPVEQASQPAAPVVVQIEESARIPLKTKLDKKLKSLSKTYKKKYASFVEKTKSMASLFANKTDRDLADILAA